MNDRPEATRVVMTLMVRDEIDVIACWLDYHLTQGIDQIIVTDNASIDGTFELLEQYAADERIELRTYEPHDKRQFAVVTQMARDAFTEYGADWVLNSDADEFWTTADGSTVGEAVRRLPKDGKAFPVKVTNMFSTPLERGFNAADAIYRDERDHAELERVGLHAQPTQNLIHPGAADVEVVQGNHFSSLPQADQLPSNVPIEVLHFPMRSWEQYRARVEMTAQAYAESPTLNPSPRHHVMRDHRWLQAGILKPFFVARHPEASNLQSGFREDRSFAERLAQVVPNRDMKPTNVFEDESTLRNRHAEIADITVKLEESRAEALTAERESLEEARNHAAQLEVHNGLQHERILESEKRIGNLEAGMEQLREAVRVGRADKQELRHQLDKYEQLPVFKLWRRVKSLVRR